MCINRYQRYQTGLLLSDLFPSIKGLCACGCGKPIPKGRKKWYSTECRDNAYNYFSIIKGDITIIRLNLFEIDYGACRSCGVITDNWQADHIIPVSQGGGGCDITNFQTLCMDCHLEKTVSVKLQSNPTLKQFHHKHPQYSATDFSLKTDIRQTVA